LRSFAKTCQTISTLTKTLHIWRPYPPRVTPSTLHSVAISDPHNVRFYTSTARGGLL